MADINSTTGHEGEVIDVQGLKAALQKLKTDKVDPKAELPDITIKEEYYVDMGLPSGTLWATRNIDVTQSDGFAASAFQYDSSFFSWGNVEGHNPISESAFDYDWGTSNDGPYAQTSGAQLTGDIPLTHDAARVNCGGPWRMPSSIQFQELFDNCVFINADGTEIADSQTDKLVTVNGVTGIYLKSKINGNLLFFACGGYGGLQDRYNYASNGRYWSSSLNSQSYGIHLSFHSGGVLPQSELSKFHGLTIRPIINPSDKTLHKVAVTGNYEDLVGKPKSEKIVEDGGGMNLVEGYYYNKKFYQEDVHTTEITGAGGRIYIDKSTNREYRFNGTKYVLLKSEVDGSFVSEGTFTYRPTAGAIDVESAAVGEGGAQIECVKGNTIAWNQGLNTVYKKSGTAGNNINIVIEGTKGTVTDVSYEGDGNDAISIDTSLYPCVLGHKYIVFVEAGIIQGEDLGYPLFEGPINQDDMTNLRDNLWYIIIGNVINTQSVGTFKYSGIKHVGDSWWFDKPMCFDLTLIYGTGNEPTTAGQFESDYLRWFGKPLTYEEYDEGSLRSVEMTGIKTVGFNQYNSATGKANVVAGNEYQITGTYTSISENEEAITPDANGKFTPTTNEVVVIGGDNNTCIHLVHSDDRNGDYEPYWEYTANLPVTQLKGKLNGEGESVVIFPDGMKKAGDVYDEIVKRGNQTVAIKRIGAVDLGSLGSWRLDVGENNVCVFSAFLPNCAYSCVPAKCSHYKVGYVCGEDKCAEVYFYFSNGVNVRDDSFNGDITSFALAMQGVTLYYGLATPEEYIIDDIDFPTEYPVDDYGTEEILSDSAKSLVPTLDIRYGLNATDTLRNLPTKYVSSIVEQNFTEEQKTRARINIGLDNLSRLGSGYGTCYTDATTAAKEVSISHFLLLVNGIVSVRFTKAVSVDGATLNVSGSGAKPILINGEALQKGLINAGMTATFQYDGTNWNVVSLMGLEQSTTPSNLYVDMGLPSGTKWAVANIDVTTNSGFAEVDGKPSPFKYESSFFSWGNTEGHNPISESAFDYDWGTSNDGPYAQTPGAALTANAGLSFDAARANLGSPWRDPSTDDFVELFNNIDFVQADGETIIDASQTNKLVTVNNIVGIYLKSKINGRLLFFPCSGYGYGQSWDFRGSYGYCWSRSLYSQTYGSTLHFNSGGVTPQNYGNRFRSFTRRAVQ